MKISYLAHFGNPNANPMEEGIEYALKQLGHEVQRIDENNFSKEKEKVDGDVLLFHKGGTQLGVSMQEFAEFLQNLDIPKVLWYPDKVWGDRFEWMLKILPLVDLAWLTDGTFVRSHSFINLHEGIFGCDERFAYKGKYKKKFDSPITFTGSTYGERNRWAVELRSKFGDDFKIWTDVFGESLNDLVASSKIIVAPDYPADDFYWSERIWYHIARGGFVIHPKLERLEEYLTDGVHYVGYKDREEMIEKIRYYLERPEARKKIADAGMKKVKSEYRFQDTLKLILQKL